VRSRNSRVSTGVACLLAAVVLFSGAVRAEDATAKIDNFTFVPARLTVKAGTTVTWRNADDIPHTVTSTTQLFKSKALDTDDSFSFTFTGRTDGRFLGCLGREAASFGVELRPLSH